MRVLMAIMFSRPGRSRHAADWFVIALLSGVVLRAGVTDDEEEIKFADCPAAVRKTLQAEAKGAKIETVTKEKNEEQRDGLLGQVAIGGKMYDVAALEDGTLTEINLAVDDEDLPLDRCPAVVQATFRSEAFGEKVDAVSRDMKYGLTDLSDGRRPQRQGIRDCGCRGRDPGGESSRHRRRGDQAL